MNDPCIFWDADRYFYGEARNPCENRYQLLTRYAAYLERAYPPLCGALENCVCKASPLQARGKQGEGYYETMLEKVGPIPIGDFQGSRHGNKHIYVRDGEGKVRSKVQYPTGVFNRSFKPIISVFNGLEGNRAWRRNLDKICRDLPVRDCGPGFALLQLLENAPEEMEEKDIFYLSLQTPFIRTEEAEYLDSIEKLRVQYKREDHEMVKKITGSFPSLEHQFKADHYSKIKEKYKEAPRKRLKTAL